MNETAIWVRAGDQDDYNSFPMIPDVVLYLRSMKVRGPLTRVPLGFSCPGFEGHNYVSLFKGDKNADPIGDSVGGFLDKKYPEAELSDEEFAQLEAEFKKEE